MASCISTFTVANVTTPIWSVGQLERHGHLVAFTERRMTLLGGRQIPIVKRGNLYYVKVRVLNIHVSKPLKLIAPVPMVDPPVEREPGAALREECTIFSSSVITLPHIICNANASCNQRVNMAHFCKHSRDGRTS